MPEAPGLRGALADIALDTSAVTRFAATPPLDLEPLALPVADRRGCGAIGADDGLVCPAATSPPAPDADGG
jgi:hypothetical protein